MKKYLFVVLVVMLMLLTAGCGNGENDKISALPAEFPAILKPVQREPKNAVVDVYWDATSSMQGYAAIPNGNFYRTLPDAIENIGTIIGDVKFFRFGKDILPLSGREHLNFRNPEYYDELITAVHNVVDKADPEHLTIIVSDLFESDADWHHVPKKVKEKFFSKHKSLGIIGIKNPFNGKIYDVGPDAAVYVHNSGDDSAKFRPFFLLVMGPDVLVREFLEKWQDNYNKSKYMQYLYLSESLMENIADLSNMSIDTKNLLLNGDANGDKRVKEFQVNSQDKETALTAEFSYKAGLGCCEIDISRFELQSQLFTWDKEKEAWIAKEVSDMRWAVTKLEENNKDKKDNQEEKYQIDISFMPDKNLPPNSINYLYVGLLPGRNAVTAPKWVREWSVIDMEEFDGSRTSSFNRTVGSLLDAMLKSANPSLADINMVIITK